MSIRNPKREELRRLESKTLDAQFKTAIQQGLNCSPFEAEAVLGVVREVYFPFMEPSAGTAPPGKVTLVAVCADEPAGKPVSDCEKRPVCLTVHRGIEDDRLMQAKGPAAYRQARIVDLCQEAMSQGALLTREDLAYRVFFVNVRTISRDLGVLRQANPEIPIPLRSTVHDIGPVLTHRVRIVRLALEGLTTTEIQRRTQHSASAIANYVSTFTRCAQLAQRDMQAGQIAFLLRRSRKLVEEYIDLLRECEPDTNMKYHLEELLRLGHGSGGKNGGDMHLIPVILDISTGEDIQARIDRTSVEERLRIKAVRLCEQAYQQGALLSNADLAELMSGDASRISNVLTAHERRTKKVVPRRATLHDVGCGITHKRIICWKRYAEGKSSDQIAHETYHTVEAVDRYLGQFDRVRHCRMQGMTPLETAYALNCSRGLVEEYLRLDRELAGNVEDEDAAPTG